MSRPRSQDRSLPPSQKRRAIAHSFIGWGPPCFEARVSLPRFGGRRANALGVCRATGSPPIRTVKSHGSWPSPREALSPPSGGGPMTSWKHFAGAPAPRRWPMRWTRRPRRRVLARPPLGPSMRDGGDDAEQRRRAAQDQYRAALFPQLHTCEKRRLNPHALPCCWEAANHLRRTSGRIRRRNRPLPFCLSRARVRRGSPLSRSWRPEPPRLAQAQAAGET